MSFPNFSAFFKKSGFIHKEVEDVQYEDVTEPSKTPEIDKERRARQLAEAMLDEARGIMYKSPATGLTVASLFMHGATWADEHPLSSFQSRGEWLAAINSAMDDLNRAVGVPTAHSASDFIARTLFSRGVDWATEHPAPLK